MSEMITKDYKVKIAELEKEAEELIQRVEMGNSMNCFMQLTPDRKQIGEMLVMIAEPREKQIAELEEKLANADYQLEGRDNEIRELENQQKIDAGHILTLQNEKGELTDRVKELEAQIEKMKLCANCKHCGVSGWCDKLNRYLLDKANSSCGNWEIKEK